MRKALLDNIAHDLLLLVKSKSIISELIVYKNMLFGFGKEKEQYSRAQYEEGENDTNTAEQENKEIHRSRDNVAQLGPISPEWEKGYRDNLRHNRELIRRTKEMLARQRGLAEEEATALNTEFDRLLKRAEDALIELDNFAANKLGMRAAEEDK